MVKEQLDDLDIALLGSYGQRRPDVRVLCISIRTFLYKQPDHLETALCQD